MIVEILNQHGKQRKQWSFTPGEFVINGNVQSAPWKGTQNEWNETLYDTLRDVLSAAQTPFMFISSDLIDTFEGLILFEKYDLKPLKKYVGTLKAQGGIHIFEEAGLPSNTVVVFE
jgi:hypothetical protein